MGKIKLAVLLGTTRENNKSQYVAQYITKVANESGHFEATLVDPAEFSFPGDGNDDSAKDPKYTKMTEESDAFVVVTPEYNHSFPGSLKRMLDSELKNYIHKPVAITGVSAGRFGGVRAIEHLIPVLRELGMIVTFGDVQIGDSYNAFNEQGEPQHDYIKDAVENSLTELKWVAEAMLWARENLQSKYHS